MLTDLCIYTIKHSDELRATLAKGGRDTYTERKKWVRAKQLLEEARRAGKRLPVIFAPAEGTFHLFAWALLEEIAPDETSSYTFSELRLFDPQPHKATLKKASNGEPLNEWFIRPYAICQTPPYLLDQVESKLLHNACADLVSLKKYEAFPLYLLRDRRPGEWVGVRESCARVGLVLSELGPDLFATWLSDPTQQDGYALVLFYDAESMWSMAAYYNRAHLLAGGSPNGTAQSAASPLLPHAPAPAPDH